MSSGSPLKRRKARSGSPSRSKDGESQNHSKRQRISTADTGSTTTSADEIIQSTVPSNQPWSDTEKVEGLWKEDGTIVLISGKHMFRVYRGILTENSTVFRDMLSSLAEGGKESYDGVPVVHLTDHWKDIRNFLRIFLDRQ